MQSRTPAAQPFLKAANTKLGTHTHTSTPFSTGRELAFVDKRGMRSGNMSDRKMDKKLQIVGEQQNGVHESETNMSKNMQSLLLW